MKITKKLLSLALAAMLLLSLAVPAMAADMKVTITKTDIKADSVVNEGGYGSLTISGVYSSDYRVDRRPQAALVDKTGKLIFNYRDSYNRFRYDSDSGIISLAPGDPYASADDLSIRFEGFGESEPIKLYLSFYKPDGSAVLSLPSHIGSEGDACYYAGPMSNGLAVVILANSSSAELSVGDSEYSAYVINKAGEKVFDLPAEFSQLSGVSAGGITMNKNIGSFGEGLAPYYEFHFQSWDSYNNVLGYMDATGKTVIDLSSRGYTGAGRFVDGLAYVCKDGKVGYIDKSGKEVIPFEYDTAYEFAHGLAAVQKGGKYGFINKTGKTVVPFAYDNSFGSGDGLLTVINNGKCGLIDTSNKVVVPLEYDDISTYENGVAYAIKDGYLYIITADQGASTTPTTPSQSESAMPTNDQLTVNGALQAPTVYKIGGSNFFKIRDLAAMLSGTEKQFDVGYDSALKSVTLTTGKGYDKQTGDLAGAATGGNQTATPSNDTIYIDGQKADVTVYKIGGSNFFMLRDLGKALDFYVGWTREDGVFIDTSKPYSE